VEAIKAKRANTIRDGMTKLRGVRSAGKGSPGRYRFAPKAPRAITHLPVLLRDSASRADERDGRVRICEVLRVERAVGPSRGRSGGGDSADDQDESGQKRLHGCVLTFSEPAGMEGLREARARAMSKTLERTSPEVLRCR
jgi:hypothetical protein